MVAHEKSVRDKETSQSRQSLGQTHLEGGQDWVRAREPTGEERARYSLASRNRIPRQKIKETALIRAPGGPVGDQRTYGRVSGCDRGTPEEMEELTWDR
jgi:hypothetical protein